MLADHSDRSGNATWVLREIIAQDVARTVIATLRDDRALVALARAGAKAGDAFDMEVGGYMDPSAGQPARARRVGRVQALEGRAPGGGLRAFRPRESADAHPQLEQVTSPEQVRSAGVDIGQFDVFAIKSPSTSAAASTTTDSRRRSC